jgi:hypothetical protein
MAGTQHGQADHEVRVRPFTIAAISSGLHPTAAASAV